MSRGSKPIPIHERTGNGTPFGVTDAEKLRNIEAIQKDFMDALQKLAGYNSVAQVYRTWVTAMAYTTAAAVAHDMAEMGLADKEYFEEVDKQRKYYVKAIESVNKNWLEPTKAMMEAFAEGLEVLQGDFLSHVMERCAKATNKNNGQFLTPSSVARMMGEILFGPNSKPRWQLERLSDPCCGGGVLLVEGVKSALEAGRSRSEIYVEAGDIDEGAVATCYLQLAALMVPAKCSVANALTMETRMVLYTPAFVANEDVMASMMANGKPEWSLATWHRLEMERRLGLMDKALRTATESPTKDQRQETSDGLEESNGAEEESIEEPTETTPAAPEERKYVQMELFA